MRGSACRAVTLLVHILLVMIMLGTGAERASAQAALRSDRAAKAMPGTYSDPPCELKGSHYKVTAANSNLKNAIETEEASKRARELQRGRDILLEALQQNKQDQSSTAWFSLARVYLYQGDLVGADSALRRAETISPKCAGAIEGLRYMVWAPLINAGAEFSKAQANDSALALFQQAAAIYPEKPQAMMGAGILLSNSGQTDSAIAYFRRAADVAERGSMPEDRNQATVNLAAMLQKANRHQEAAAALESYLGWMPNDTDAKHALAASYRATGQTEKAQQLDRQLLAAAGAADTSAAGGAPVGVDDAMRIGVNFYNDKNWAEAARAFEQAVAAAPYSRDPLYNLANSYLASNDPAKLVPVAEKLVAIEPMSEDALMLLGTGYRQSNRESDALKTAEWLIGLPLNLVVESFTVAADGATLTGTGTGRAAQTAKGKPIPPAAMALMFEFVDARGSIVTAEDVQVPTLKAGETFKLSVQAQGKGIVGWRYKAVRQP